MVINLWGCKARLKNVTNSEYLPSCFHPSCIMGFYDFYKMLQNHHKMVKTLKTIYDLDQDLLSTLKTKAKTILEHEALL